LASNHSYAENELSRQLLAGEQTALEQVFRLFYKRLLFFAFKMTGDQIVAEDIVQDAFINFWSIVIDKHNVPSNIEGYLFRTVRNLCLNHIQRQRMINEKNDAVLHEFYEGIEQRMDELLVRENLFHEIKKQFVHLTPAQIAVMQLLYVDGLSISEAAEQMNTTAVNVRNHKARAIERLKAVLEKEIWLFVALLSHFL